MLGLEKYTLRPLANRYFSKTSYHRALLGKVDTCKLPCDFGSSSQESTMFNEVEVDVHVQEPNGAFALSRTFRRLLVPVAGQYLDWVAQGVKVESVAERDGRYIVWCTAPASVVGELDVTREWQTHVPDA